MTRETHPTALTTGNGEVTGTAELRAEIEQTRRDLGDTVEALAAKADVKARARETADRVKTDMSARGQRMKTDMSARSRRVARNAKEAPKGPVIAVGVTGLAVAGAIVVLRVRSRGSMPRSVPRSMSRSVPPRRQRRGPFGR